MFFYNTTHVHASCNDWMHRRQYPDRVLSPPAHWRLILLIMILFWFLEANYTPEYLGFPLLGGKLF